MDDTWDILRWPNSVLRERIANELLENPVLELDDSEAYEEADGDVLADVVVDRTPTGQYGVRVVNVFTQLSISLRYDELYHDPALEAKTRDYLGRKIKAARRLIEAAEWRRATLHKVGAA